MFTFTAIHTPLKLVFVDVKPLLQKNSQRDVIFINKQKRIAKRHYNFRFDTVIVGINTCTSQPHCKTKKKKPQQHIYIYPTKEQTFQSHSKNEGGGGGGGLRLKIVVVASASMYVTLARFSGCI